MCNPMAVLAFASTGLSLGQQMQNRKAQLKVQKQANDAEKERLAKQQSAERIQEGIEAEQRAGELRAAAKRVQEARATARTAAGESNVAGKSVDLLLDQYTKQGTALAVGIRRGGRIAGLATSLRIDDQAQQSKQNLIRINQPVAGIDYGSAVLTGVSTFNALTSAKQSWSEWKAGKTSTPAVGETGGTVD